MWHPALLAVAHDYDIELESLDAVGRRRHNTILGASTVTEILDGKRLQLVTCAECVAHPLQLAPVL